MYFTGKPRSFLLRVNGRFRISEHVGIHDVTTAGNGLQWSPAELRTTTEERAERGAGGCTGPAFEVCPSQLGQTRYPRLGSSQGVSQDCYPSRQAAVRQPPLPSYLSPELPLYVPVLCNQTQRLDVSQITILRENSGVEPNLHWHVFLRFFTKYRVVDVARPQSENVGADETNIP